MRDSQGLRQGGWWGVLLVLLLWLAWPGEAQSGVDPALERRKLELEVQKLEREVKSISVAPYGQAATVCIALLAAGISFWSAWRSQRSQAVTLANQIRQHQKDRISGLLKELGSEHHGVRIAAIQALSDNPETHAFLVNLLKYETDGHIVDSICVALTMQPQAAVPLLVQATKALHQQMLACGVELIAAGMDRKEVAEWLKMGAGELIRWQDSRYGKRVAGAVATRLASLNLTPAAGGQSPGEILKGEVGARWHLLETAYRNVLMALEAVLERVAAAKAPLVLQEAYLAGVILDSLDLTGWSFERCTLQDASLKHIQGKGARFTRCDLDRASFEGALLEESRFEDCDGNETSFITAKLGRSSFENCRAYKAKFYGAKLGQAQFSGGNLVQAKMEQMMARKISFTGTVLKGATFIKTMMPEATFRRVDLSGAAFTEVRAQGALVEEATWAGNDLTKADWQGARLVRSSFRAIQAFGESRWVEAQVEECTFEAGAQEFQAYITAQAREGAG